MLVSLHVARDSGLIHSYNSFDEPWCFLFNTITRAFVYIGRPISPIFIDAQLGFDTVTQ